jgi:hypothetical protein
MVILVLIVWFFQVSQDDDALEGPRVRETTEKKKRNCGTRNPDKAEKTRRNLERAENTGKAGRHSL